MRRAAGGLLALLALGALLPLGIRGARADGIDLSRGGPIEVTSRDGIEWRQAQQLVIARGDARAVRGDDQVMADTLIAHYRKKAATTTPSSSTTPAPALPAPTTRTTPKSTVGPLGSDTGDNEIYRLEADGHVKIFNQTDIAVGDHAIYDMDQAVLLLTGKNMVLTTPTQVMTARDSMEYWSQKHMAVGRGLATVTTSDGRRLAGDVLVGFTAPNQGAAPAPQTVAAKHAGAPNADPIASSGKLQRVEAFGHVEVRTATETITGERAVYVADPGIARVVGNVVVTRGLNRAVGDEAIINMNTGVSRLIRLPGRRVEGLIVPSETGKQAPSGKPTKPAAAGKPTKPARQ